MGIVVMWLPLTASPRPLSGLRCTEVVLWSSTVSKALVVSVFGDSVTIIAGAYRTARMYVSDGTDASFGRYGSSCRPMRVARGGQQLRGGTSSFAGTPSSFAKVPSSFAGMCSRRGGVLPRLAGTMAVGRSRGLDVNGMGSAVRGMGSAACLADWGKQKKQFRRTASNGWQMGLEPTTFRTTI